ncbi:MAG: hypothetical protein KDG52_09660 [Rhodocyclaceae bacterium]|nr:hypothetical protein [Rhodocyclaceae bacterium]
MADFKTLWDNFPDKDAVAGRCFNKQKGGQQPFDNYCAILLSECLVRSGMTVDRCPGTKCWSHEGARHVLRAEDLAAWFDKSPPEGFGARENVAPAEFQKRLSGRTGVVFFKDYWTRGNERFASRSGDHIDLWRRNEITGGGMFYRSLIEMLGLVSDLNKSREIWFWEVS